MTVLSQSRLQADVTRVRPSIAADALTRIPSEHFLDLAWAKASIATCTSMLARAAGGDGAHMSQWVHDTHTARDRGALVSVLHAVCDAIVADAFRSHGHVAGLGSFVASLERDIVEQLTIEQRQHPAPRPSDDSTAQLVAGLVQLVGMHDPDAVSRLDEVTAIARRIARELRLPQARIATVELAARLHDIGHVGVRPEILAKPAALTSQETAEVRGHVELGSALLGDLPALAHLAPIVRAHHERCDGRGYPDCLRGDEIPLESRIIAVADAVAALTSPRPYRPALALGDALAVVAQHAGTQFDVAVARAASAIFHGAPGGYREIA